MQGLKQTRFQRKEGWKQAPYSCQITHGLSAVRPSAKRLPDRPGGGRGFTPSLAIPTTQEYDI